MGRHFTERTVARALAVFARDSGFRDFQVNEAGKGPDATAMWRGEPVEFEVKACAARVVDVSKPNGTRPGRFRIDPAQHGDLYGTDRLWYVLVTYDGDEAEHAVVQLRIVRSDQLPQRGTVISLSATAAKTEEED